MLKNVPVYEGTTIGFPLGTPYQFTTPYQDQDYIDLETGVCGVPEGIFVESQQSAFFNLIDNAENYTMLASGYTFTTSIENDPQFSNFRDPCAPF